MSMHEITIQNVNDFTKYGNARRKYHAVCSCGWTDNWWPVRRWSAIEGGERHTEKAVRGES